MRRVLCDEGVAAFVEPEVNRREARGDRLGVGRWLVAAVGCISCLGLAGIWTRSCGLLWVSILSCWWRPVIGTTDNARNPASGNSLTPGQGSRDHRQRDRGQVREITQMATIAGSTSRALVEPRTASVSMSSFRSGALRAARR